VLSLVVCAALAGAPPWVPPPNADPSAILQEARRDAREGRHEVALAKFLWFHHHALDREQGLSGVRLSFALGYWHQLARQYPPALDALKKTRDEALADVQRAQGGDVFQPFHDFASINRELGEQSRTARAFVELDRENPAAAATAFHVAQPSLIGAREYGLCGKYLRPDEEWQMAARVYQLDQDHERRSSPDIPRSADKFFTHRVTTLVALLVVNGRRQDAEAIAQKARLELDDPAFRAAIDAALTGAVPDPWP
jgi:hypothetical protein